MIEEMNYSFDALTNQLKLLSNNFNFDSNKVMSVKDTPNGFEINNCIDYQVIQSLSRIPGSSLDVIQDKWVVPYNFNAAKQLLELAEAHNYWFTHNSGGKLLEILNLSIPGMECTLRPYQKEAVKFIKQNKSVLIADEKGLGKTVEALAAVQYLKLDYVLIVCPVSLKSKWSEEISQKLPGNTVCILKSGEPKKIENTRFVIVNYDILEKYFSQLKEIPFKAIIFDESQKLKSNKTQWHTPAIELSKSIHYKILLSETPVEIRPRELINQLMVMGKLEKFGGEKYFGDHYCNGTWKSNFKTEKTYWNIQGASNLAELQENLLHNGYLRRSRKDVCSQLPTAD
jgi:SNF2 family DNA or RNA helicase